MCEAKELMRYFKVQGSLSEKDGHVKKTGLLKNVDRNGLVGRGWEDFVRMCLKSLQHPSEKCTGGIQTHEAQQVGDKEQGSQ